MNIFVTKLHKRKLLRLKPFSFCRRIVWVCLIILWGWRLRFNNWLHLKRLREDLHWIHMYVNEHTLIQLYHLLYRMSVDFIAMQIVINKWCMTPGLTYFNESLFSSSRSTAILRPNSIFGRTWFSYYTIKITVLL